MWWMHRRIDPSRFPEGRVVLEFAFTAPDPMSVWLVLERGEVSVCHQHPGSTTDVRLRGDHRGVQRGLQRACARWADAVRAGRPRGGRAARGWSASCRRWFLWSPWRRRVRERVARAYVDPAAVSSSSWSAARTSTSRRARPLPWWPRTSNPGTVVRTPGGVGRNVAENLARLGSRVALVSTVGSDPDGDWLLEETAAAGRRRLAGAARRPDRAGTSRCSTPAATWRSASRTWRPPTRSGPEVLDHDLIRSADLVVVDGNLPATTVDAVLALGVRVVIDPVSVAKAERIAPLLEPDRPVFAITPNEDELVGAGLGRRSCTGAASRWCGYAAGAAGSLLSTRATARWCSRRPASTPWT